MITIIIRAVILYVLLLFLIRLMGKRQIGQMQPFELVLTIIIADLATIPMGDLAVPLLHGVVPLFTLAILHFILTMITKKSSILNKFISGKPVIIVNSKGVDSNAINSLKISVDDVFASIREKGFFGLEQIEYAIMETNGTVTVMPKQKASPVTVGDMKIDADENNLPVTLVAEGKILKDNLKIAEVDETFINKILKQAKIKNVKNCLVLTIDVKHNVYVQEIGKKFLFFEEFK
jgi:uncharacterized membrane protein YcaP (DUF421 family)